MTKRITNHSSFYDTNPINRDNLERYTGCSFTTWIRLTGFFDGKLKGEVPEKDIIIEGKYPVFSLFYHKFHLSITVNIQTLVIENNSIILPETGTGLGCIAHENQIALASYLGFEQIKLKAVGGMEGLNGNVTWGKFGYTMTDDSHLLFLAKIKQDGIKAKCLHQLLYTDEGCNYLLNSGIDWNGRFDLSEKSINKRLYNKYKKRKD